MPFHPDVPLNADLSHPVSLHAITYESYLQTKPLRKENIFENHKVQLEVILATSGDHAITVNEWAAIFANKHKLNIKIALNNAIKLRRRIKLIMLLELISVFINKWELDSNKVKMKNVYQVSLVASETLKHTNYFLKVRRFFLLFNKGWGVLISLIFPSRFKS